MSAPTTVELDFFAMENHAVAVATAKSRRQSLFRRQRSLKDIQSAISKIKPEILKSVIASGNCNRIAPRSPEFGDRHLSLPHYSPNLRTSPQNAPLTIFYNETVAVFHVSRDEAESILSFAEKRSCSGKGEVEKGRSTDEIPSNQSQGVDAHPQDEDLPLARKRSLQRFLEKRKERLIPSWAYACRF